MSVYLSCLPCHGEVNKSLHFKWLPIGARGQGERTEKWCIETSFSENAFLYIQLWNHPKYTIIKQNLLKTFYSEVILSKKCKIVNILRSFAQFPLCYHFVQPYTFPRWLSGKESACQAGDAGLIPGLGRSPGEGNGSPLQHSYLGNPMDRGAWQSAVMELQRIRLNWVTKHAAPITIV